MLEIAYTMHRGKVCRQQQDCLLIAGDVIQASDLPATTRAVSADDVLLAVADGVARSAAPRDASRVTLEELAKAVYEHPEWLRDGFASARHLRHVQQRLADRLGSSRRTYGASSTLALAHIRADRAVVLNAGDSRVYHVDQSGHWRRLSKDHTILQAMIDRREAQPGTQYASIYDGLDSALVADHEEDEFIIHRETASLALGGRLVLCTDGVHDVLGEAEMWRLFDPARSAAAQAQRWRDTISRRGAPDNFSLLICELEGRP